METNFYIPAGGEGQRLRPLTAELPKPLLPIARRDDDTTERIIDTPVSIGRELGTSLVVAGSYKADRLEEYFAKENDIQVVRDTGIVHIGGSMIQHRRELFAGNPEAIAMVPGDHYLPERAVARMLGTLSCTGADVVILGTWKKSYHEEYAVEKQEGSIELAREPSVASDTISALGTYVMNAEWLARRLDTVPVDSNGHCDLTTDVIFGKDQTPPPKILFEPLQDDERWEDVGTIHRLYGHIRSIHPVSAQDERGNINLTDVPVGERATDSVIYFGANNYPGGHSGSFIANDFVERCA